MQYLDRQEADRFASLRPRSVFAFLLLTIIAGIVVRFLFVDYSLSTDEIASTNFAELSLSYLWSDAMVVEVNPPLYYSLLKAWRFLFGDSDVAARLMSATLGVGSLAVSYLLGRQVAGTKVGIVAAALMAVSPAHVLYSQQVRNYILAFDFAGLALLGALVFCSAAASPDDHRRRKAGAALYATSCVGAVYCHTTLVLLPLFTTVFVLWWIAVRGYDRGRSVVTFMLANLVVLACWSWWGRMALLQMGRPEGTIDWIKAPTALEALATTARSYVPPGVEFADPMLNGAAIAIVLVPAALLFVRGVQALRGGPGMLLPFVAIVVPVALYAISQVVPVLLPRTVFWASGAFTVVVAAGIWTIGARWARNVVLVAALGVGLASGIAVHHRFEIEPWRRIVTEIQAIDPEATVVTNGRIVSFDLRHYCPQPDCALDIRETGTAVGWTTVFPGERSARIEDLPALLAERGRIVTMSRGASDLERAMGPAASRDLGVRTPSYIRATVWEMRGEGQSAP